MQAERDRLPEHVATGSAPYPGAGNPDAGQPSKELWIPPTCPTMAVAIPPGFDNDARKAVAGAFS